MKRALIFLAKALWLPALTVAQVMMISWLGKAGLVAMTFIALSFVGYVASSIAEREK